MMLWNLRIGLFSAIMWLPGLLWASTLTQPQSTLYPFQSSIEYQDEFLWGTTTTGSIGSLGWSSAGTITGQSSIANRFGIVRIDTSAVIGTVARLNPFSSVAIDPALPTVITWIVALNTNDANTTVRYGSGNAVGANPPTHGIYIEKLDADTNWFCVTRAGGVQTRTDSTVAVTTTFTTFTYTRNSSGVQFSINNVNVCSLMTTNIPTTFVAPFMFIINSAAAAKTTEVDYFNMIITGIVR